jgi:hypothetical protein
MCDAGTVPSPGFTQVARIFPVAQCDPQSRHIGPDGSAAPEMHQYSNSLI